MIFSTAYAAFVAILLLLAGCAEYPVQESVQTRTITWRRTPDASATCDLISPPGRNHFTVACAVWFDKNCTILTSPADSDETLGHEVRHCFDGAWHP